MKKNHPFIPPLSEEGFLRRIRKEQLFVVEDCTLEVPVEMRKDIADFPPIFKNCEISRDDIGNYMKCFGQINILLRMLISSFKLEHGPIFTPLRKFYLEKGLIVKKIHWFLQYKPQKTFEGFVSPVVGARRRGDENKDSSVVAETMKLIANSSYGHQIIDRSRHTNTKFVLGSEVDRLVNNCMFFEGEMGRASTRNASLSDFAIFIMPN